MTIRSKERACEMLQWVRAFAAESDFSPLHPYREKERGCISLKERKELEQESETRQN